jgi:hypothetical protein
VFNEAMQYWGQLQAHGHIERFEAYSLGAHGGDLHGFALLRDDRAKLAQIGTSEEFVRLVTRADLTLQGVEVVPAVTGDEFTQQYALWQQQASELARRSPICLPPAERGG